MRAAPPIPNLRLDRRGSYKEVTCVRGRVRSPKIQGHAAYEKPHQYATGLLHVFVSGVQVLENGEHTGAKPGRFVRGPGGSDEVYRGHGRMWHYGDTINSHTYIERFVAGKVSTIVLCNRTDLDPEEPPGKSPISI